MKRLVPFLTLIALVATAPGAHAATKPAKADSKTSAKATARNAKQNSGIRLIDIPGARSLKIVTMRLIAVAVDERPVKMSPRA